MARFKKGQSGNPKGKKPGTKSEKTLFWESLKDYITGDGADKYKEELMALEGREFIDKYTQILEYFKPKQARKETAIDPDANKVEIIIRRE